MPNNYTVYHAHCIYFQESYENDETTPVLNGEQSKDVVEEKSARVPSITESELSSPTILSPNFGDAYPIPIKASPARNSKVKPLSGSSPSAHRMADAFPTISYSSSEDEDEAEFFDANEYEHESNRLV